MDSKKAAQLLDRVNALHRSLHQDGEESSISAIERDLMLSYLRQLYEIYQIENLAQATSPAPKKSPAPTPRPSIPLEIEEKNEPKADPPPAPPQEPPAEPAYVPPVTPTPPLAAAVPPPAPAAPIADRGDFKKKDPKLAQLFVQPETKELSERLAQQPLKDLTRALTINNRVQYANTLFGGNSDLMNSVLLRLNQLDSMAAARPDLEELAMEFNWLEEEKMPVAQDFIKLVNRRYA